MSEEQGSLSKSLLKICKGDMAAQKSPQIWQITEIIPFEQGNTGQKRVRVHVSDGQYWMEALVSTSTSSYFETNEAVVGTIIEVNNMTVNRPNGKHILILLGFDILQKDCELLEDPKPILDVLGTAAPAAPTNNTFGSKPAFGGNQNAFGAQPTNNPFGGRSKPTTGGNQYYQPLSDLSPFQKQAFTIKVRVTRKGTIRHWSNKRGDGKLFSIDILDEHGNEMQCTMFNDTVDKFFSVFEEGKVFTIHKGRIKMANKRYTHIQAEYSLDLTSETEVNLVSDDAGIAGMKYDFKPISDLAQMQDRSFMDVFGMVDHVSEVQRFTSKKTGNELTKRAFRIVDQSTEAVECVLWGDEALNFSDSYLHQAVAIKAARVSEFNGKSLSVNKYEISPNLPEISALVEWWNSEGKTAQVKSHTTARTSGGRNEPPISLREVLEGDYGVTSEPKYFNTKVTIHGIPHDPKRLPWYNAVPEDAKGDDGKSLPAYKVIDDGNGGWLCERNNMTYSTCAQRYILRLRAVDHTGEQWFNSYDDAARLIMGVPASDINAVVKRSYDENNEPNWATDEDEEAFNAFFDNVSSKRFNIRVRAKSDEYNGEARRRFDILGATPIDEVEDGHQMLTEIEAMLKENPTIAA